MNGISKLLSTDGFIQVNKTLIKKLGLHEAIIIGELCAEYNYWEEHGKLEDDMFYSTRDNIEENTGLNDHYQRKALTSLKDAGIISICKKDVPAKNYYKIHFDKLLILLSSSSSRDEELEVHEMNLNNNKQTKIDKQRNNSKELLQNSDFQFGKSKPKKESLFTKCVTLTDDFISQHNCGNPIRKKLIEYLNYRLSIKDKPLYTNMWKGMLNKLDLLHKEGYAYEAIIDFCLERGYLSFYPPSNFSKQLDVTKGKAWEENVSCRQATEEELAEIERLNKERKAKGLRVTF